MIDQQEIQGGAVRRTAGVSTSAGLPSALTYRVNVAAAKLGVSRSTIYRMIKDGDLELVKIRKRASGVTAESLHTALEQRKAAR
ncbi:helix-turn-helix domain-containing protein [Pseudomonas aeruginosa]|uniref:Helix-turn-helix domain-containing protein n=1 Tax=Ideonella dechloratans TaxID=36863 RepID=A0A643FH14_IDEDE|nr:MULTISPECIES: excisionase family DNA-binding protein [Burkholderiales]KAB0584778.1 helix-turn-helix domain-containing protein [Ideonella dechloratans]MCU8942188.1 helix-turn-helix domain-containing protein [Pseudomonas aeruginosa]PRF93099.1 hypothetical protein C6Q23_05100 [Burkholderia multivorans]UFU12216.1 helix-turn-helix domain-containing protein [Ideonella dechloratans]